MPQPVPHTTALTEAVTTQLRAAGCVFAEDEAHLLTSAARTPAELTDLLDQRTHGQPLEHVLGWAEFCGLHIAVAPGVFVPRRRTEFLAVQAAAHTNSPHRSHHRPDTVVDLCCGTGAVAAALIATVDRVALHATDIDPTAVQCAHRNISAGGGRVYEGDLYEPLPAELRANINVLVANAPYVPSDAIGTMPPEARVHEPLTALDGGTDGLDIQRRVIAEAPVWLAPGGYLLVESSEDQAPEAVATFARNGLNPTVARSDTHGATVVIGRAPENP